MSILRHVKKSIRHHPPRASLQVDVEERQPDLFQSNLWIPTYFFCTGAPCFKRLTIFQGQLPIVFLYTSKKKKSHKNLKIGIVRLCFFIPSLAHAQRPLHVVHALSSYADR